ncbi:DUF134 domain-containing protein [Methanoregula sp.]|uniref:DUF134 domain-containing protein n=1 Tax=Methanoregula sp. TaxID=2052170 RepID=UPI003568A540
MTTPMEPDGITGIPECHRRGRPRIRRIIESGTDSRCYEPRCCPHEDGIVISLQPEEIELIRLVDLEGLEQEEAAEKLGVSRKTAWRDLHEARRKIADALVNGKGIEIAGCQKAAEGRCPKCPRKIP